MDTTVNSLMLGKILCLKVSMRLTVSFFHTDWKIVRLLAWGTCVYHTAVGLYSPWYSMPSSHLDCSAAVQTSENVTLMYMNLHVICEGHC